MNAKDKARFSKLVADISGELQKVGQALMIINERLDELERKEGIEGGADAAVERINARFEAEKAEDKE